mmetsp:Transcript_61327/g.144940  ORF Transcript_61327/g.144940 Transcript_61327/m.144940 type:complete len:322 (-) Transcript_61327:2503-3468(-)
MTPTTSRCARRWRKPAASSSCHRPRPSPCRNRCAFASACARKPERLRALPASDSVSLTDHETHPHPAGRQPHCRRPARPGPVFRQGGTRPPARHDPGPDRCPGGPGPADPRQGRGHPQAGPGHGPVCRRGTGGVAPGRRHRTQGAAHPLRARNGAPTDARRDQGRGAGPGQGRALGPARCPAGLGRPHQGQRRSARARPERDLRQGQCAGRRLSCPDRIAGLGGGPGQHHDRAPTHDAAWPVGGRCQAQRPGAGQRAPGHRQHGQQRHVDVADPGQRLQPLHHRPGPRLHPLAAAAVLQRPVRRLRPHAQPLLQHRPGLAG